MTAPQLALFDGVVPFVATAEAKSFRAAARSLGVTPSAISKAIAKLESDVGVRLLHRSSRSVVLTTEGEEFLRACREAADGVRIARELLSHTQRAPRGLLRVSLPPTFASSIAAALPALLERHPGLTIEVVASDRFVRLADENVDVAVRIGEVEDSAYVAHRLRKLRLATVASPAYLARHGTPRTPADLASHNCLLFVLANGLPRAWSFSTAGEAARSVRVAGTLTANQGEVLLGAARAGLGLVQAPDVMVDEPVVRGELVEVLQAHAAEGPPLNVLCAPGQHRSPKVRVFVELMKKLTGPRRPKRLSGPRGTPRGP